MRQGADAGGCFPTGRHYPGIAHLLRAVSRGTLEGYAAEAMLAELPVISMDVEATGLDPHNDRVVEVACVVFSPAGVERHSWLVNPGCPIPEESRAVHQISDDDVRDQPAFAALAPAIAEVMGRGIPMAYNAEFDRAFLAAEFARAGWAPLPAAFSRGVVWLDPLIWARQLQRDEKSKSLGAVAERLGIEMGQAHRAADDAEAAGHVFRAFLRQSDVPGAYGAFVQEQRRLSRSQADERQYWRG